MQSARSSTHTSAVAIYAKIWLILTFYDFEKKKRKTVTKFTDESVCGMRGKLLNVLLSTGGGGRGKG